MAQPIAGVTPAEVAETAIMEVWPSIARCSVARFLADKFFSIRFPDAYFLRIGHLFAAASIPFCLALYFFRLAPSIAGLAWHGVRYKLTNRRLLEVRSEIHFRSAFPFFEFRPEVPTKSVDLDRFDRVETVRLSGHDWFDAGDLVFFKGNVETFRLEAVSRPESFRHTCIKAQMAHSGVKKARSRELASA